MEEPIRAYKETDVFHDVVGAKGEENMLLLMTTLYDEIHFHVLDFPIKKIACLQHLLGLGIPLGRRRSSCRRCRSPSP